MYAGYLSDEEMVRICSDEQLIRYMLDFEMALAKAQSGAGLVPAKAAEAISQSLSKLSVSPSALTESTLKNGIPTIGLLAEVKKHLSEDAHDFLHLGATSQDMMDTAAVLVFKDAVIMIEGRIKNLLHNLLHLIEKEGDAPCMARTRWQQATPIPFGLKIASWCQPLVRHLERLQELRKRLLVVQLGGASGSLAAMQTKGEEVMRKLANKLGLSPSSPWHSQRDNVGELGNWLSLLTGSLGKMGQDILLMAQTEVGEVVENAAGGGKSSAMPHKNNPVLSEALVYLGRENTTLTGLISQSLLHGAERDGSAWMLEWRTLPHMLVNTAAALKHALTLTEKLQVNRQRMLQNIQLTNGLVYAEQAVSILAKSMSKAKATAIVNEACVTVDAHRSLAEALETRTKELNLKWKELLQPEACFGSSLQMIKRAKEAITRAISS